MLTSFQLVVPSRTGYYIPVEFPVQTLNVLHTHRVPLPTDAAGRNFSIGRIFRLNGIEEIDVKGHADWQYEMRTEYLIQG